MQKAVARYWCGARVRKRFQFHERYLLSTTTGHEDFKKKDDVPFYGLPREEPQSTSPFNSQELLSNPLSSAASFLQHVQQNSRIALLAEQAMTAIRDPTRADAVAAVGELTGTLALQQLHDTMQADPQGKIILKERPIVSKETIPYDEIIASVDQIDSSSMLTFGQAYGRYLKSHDFDPDERDEIKYINNNPDLAYVMLRYRQCHDFWHALTDLPPTVSGELGLKWLELFQTGMPMAAMSATVGSLSMNSLEEQRLLWNVYLPWAQRVASNMPFGALLMVYYEREFDTPLAELRQRIGITEPAPVPPPSTAS